MTCSKTNINLLAGLLKDCRSTPPGAFAHGHLDPEAEAARLIDRAAGDDAFLAVENRAAALVHDLEWDTHFFGFPCARIDTIYAAGNNRERYGQAKQAAAKALEWCDRRKVRFVNVKIPGPDPVIVQALEDLGFRVADTTVAMTRQEKRPLAIPNLPDGYRFSQVVTDPAALAKAFSRLFYDGRFHNDQRMPGGEADRLWSLAVKSQVSGLARDVLLLEHEGRPAGLATLAPEGDGPEGPPPPGCLFIFGLLEPHRGQGLGRALLAETLRRFQDGYKRLAVETSTFNLPAVKLYRSFGFEPEGFKISLHLWR